MSFYRSTCQHKIIARAYLNYLHLHTYSDTPAKQYAYAFIFLDIGLPDIDGIKVASIIRHTPYSLSQNTHIVALSAHLDETDQKRCLKEGINEVLIKPLTLASAKKALKSIPNTV